MKSFQESALNLPSSSLIVRKRGVVDYEVMLEDMRTFTHERTDETPDEVWVLQHTPVFTQGRMGKEEHILKRSHVPIVHTDRGGQVTYHGPGQLIMYLLIDLRRHALGVKGLVCLVQKLVISALEQWGVEGHLQEGAPGVYVERRKICSLGLRIRQGCSYHGLSLNVNMDMTPFSWIHPCGYSDLVMTQLADLGVMLDCQQAAQVVLEKLFEQLPYTEIRVLDEGS